MNSDDSQMDVSQSGSQSVSENVVLHESIVEGVNFHTFDELQVVEGHVPYVNVLTPNPTYEAPSISELKPSFLYGPKYALPLSYLNRELTKPLIDEIYDELGKLASNQTRSGDEAGKRRQPAYDLESFKRVGSKSDSDKFRCHFSNARQFVDTDRLTDWSN